MTIARAIIMLGECKNDMNQAVVENVGSVTLFYDGELRKVSEPIYNRYRQAGFDEFWKTYGSLGANRAMNFYAGERQSGDSPSGGSWEDWDSMEWDQRLVSLIDEFIEEWAKEYKDLTLADASLTKGGDFGPLARHIRNIITGGNTHGGQAGLFASDSDPTSLASVAGIHDKTGSMFTEMLAEWMKFMLTHEAGVVRRVATRLQQLTALRVVQN